MHEPHVAENPAIDRRMNVTIRLEQPTGVVDNESNAGCATGGVHFSPGTETGRERLLA
jgi:hypothetical protein